MHYRPFKSVLIANRGEIAVRVVKEAQASDLRAIAVYSDADQKAWHVQSADAAIHIGPSPAAESYLSIPKLIAAAKATKAEAIHPGYGFLSENADFAQAVIDAGLIWIGPSPDAIRAMGDKGNAKELARKANVPVIPGYDGDDQSDARLLSEAQKIGWPVLIKAALGGGGRGQRKIAEEATFLDALASARREALSAFASDRMILEKALENVRHIEVQVFGDSHGNVIHLGERDCSVQRRNQKIIEEAPALGVSEDLRNRMGAAAVALAKAVNYTNAGTVEYLLDAADNFYFLEMNTRIQVEHPVTEEITGTNLIQWQFDVAAGKTLPMSQSEVHITGHAIEARLCAEDPDLGFAPQIGELASWSTPRWARVDYGLQWDATIPAEYDSLLAKIIGRGPTREDARQQLVRALEDGHALGVKTNRNYLLQILEMDDFVAGTYNLGILASYPGRTVPALHTDHASIAALLLAFGEKGGWSSSGIRTSSVTLRAGSSTQTFRIENRTVNGMELLKTDCEITPWSFTARDDSGEFTDFFVQRGTHIHLNWARTDEVFEDTTYAPAERKDSAGAGAVRAPMAGKIIKIAAAAGATVAKGDLLVILEAMKMEHELRAATDGIVDTIAIKAGDQVAMRQLLVTVKSV